MSKQRPVPQPSRGKLRAKFFGRPGAMARRLDPEQRCWPGSPCLLTGLAFGLAAALVGSLIAVQEATAASPDHLQFVVSLAPPIVPARGAGRLFVMLAGTEGMAAAREPRFGPDWFRPAPFFARDLADLKPGETVTIDDSADGFPAPLSQLHAGRFRVQAVFHQNPDARSPGLGVGNLYSDVIEATLDPRAPQALHLPLAHVIAERTFPELPWRHEVAVHSKLLSEYLHREVVERAAVVLPKSYAAKPDRRFPVIYFIPGFGGTHFDALGISEPPGAAADEIELIRVFLSGDCQWGHHVYADSATNGPRGRALVNELIPEIDSRFRTIARPEARYVAGHSSGGWSSLWLQVTFPDQFGGVWSSSPDPVDFRDFQQIDLYAQPPLNMYRTPRGERRPIARRGTEPVLFFDDFCRLEEVLGRGGQLRSFEAVFSPLDASGLPRRLWDSKTGAIDPQTAAAWRKYDINLVLRDQWPTLGPKLAGKLHIVMGALDTFYLEGATQKLGETLRELGSDADVVIVPGHDHGSILATPEFRRRGRQIAETFWRHFPRPAPIISPSIPR